MIDFGTRAKALRVNSVLTLLRRGEGKAFAYARYFVGNRIASLVDDLSHLRTNSLPNAGLLPSFYESVMLAIRMCKQKKLNSVKEVYEILVASLYVEPRCKRFWEGSQSGIAWKEVWRGLRVSRSENIVKEVRWRCVQRIIKTRYDISVWGYKVSGRNCAVCGQEETLEHCFLKCPMAFFVWEWVRALLVPIARDFVAGASSVFLCRFDYGPKANVIVTFVIECNQYCSHV